MPLKDEPITRLDNAYRKLELKRVEACRVGDVPRALRYAARAGVIYRAADAIALGRIQAYRD